ncbi:hypothetical protein TrST_g6546 [Triparma strigata]|uniref:WD repeat-containing protein 65 n=1 Tax=Triparma strigata TaxID=1606541 RepID=A0A9W7AYA4_9STRA|nr:hypothetical protein TrST_g6546 [Triparma strigata]
MSSGLQHRFMFGVNGEIRHNVDFVEDAVISYVAGHNLVFYDQMEKRQKFIHGRESASGISSVALCPNKKYIALAEKGDTAAIAVYNIRTLRKFKNLHYDKWSTKEVVNMAFSADNQLLLTLGGAPDWTLVCWNWNKAKVLSYVQVSENFPLYQTSFCPLDASVACVSGKDRLSFYRVLDNELRVIPSSTLTDTNVLCHVWMKQPEDHLVVGTDEGELLVYEKSSLLCKLAQSPKNMGITSGDGDASSFSGPIRIESLVAVSKGFIAGCSNATFRLYSLVTDRPASATDMFQCSCTWSVNDHNSEIMSMSLSPNEDSLVAVLSDNQIVQCSMVNPNNVKNEDVKDVMCKFHGPGAITGMDLCVRKPLAVTSGMDKTVRIWNYMDFKLEFFKQFNEDPLSVAFHPSGLHLLIGFADKLRLMNVLMDDIRPFREVSIKMCRECCFSHGGQYFAAVNGNIICIFDFYTGEKVQDMRGHNSKVKGLTWGDDDSTLISCGQDGAVYLWNVAKGTRIGDFVQKGIMYNCAIGNNEHIWAVGSEKMIRQLELPDMNTKVVCDSDVPLGQIILSHSQHAMFAVTAVDRKPGCVRAYAFPLGGEYLEYPCLGGPVTRMRITHNDQFLFVADDVGNLCVFSVKDKSDKRSLTGGKTDSGAMAWSEEVLVTKSDLEEKHALMQELKNKVDELALHNEYQLRLKDMNYTEKIKEQTEKFTQDLEQDKNKFELLSEEKNDMEMEYEERLKQMDEKHQHQLQELEGSYQQKIMGEVERYQHQCHERDLQKDRWENQQRMLIQTHEKYVAELTEDFEQKLDEDKSLRITYEEEKGDLQREFDEVKMQLEDDIDTEIQNLRAKYDQQLAAEREATLRFKGENGIMKKKFTVLQKEIEDQKEEIKLLLEKEKELHEQIKALEREIQAHKREIKSRDDTIGEKEKKIYELKKKNQELEKFKFVLDYKIKELKRQIEPRETEISNMKGQIKDMDKELETYHKSNAQLDLMIGELRAKLDSMQKEILGQRKVIGDQESLMRRCKSELHECAQVIQSPKDLEEKISKLYKQHVQKNATLQKNDVDNAVQDEYARHHEFLEKTLQSLKIKFAKDVKAHKSINVALMQSNIQIIQEISQQRDANKMTKQMLAAKLGDYKLRRQRDNTPNTTSPRLSSSNSIGDAGAIQQLEINKKRISELRQVVKQMENEIVNSKSNKEGGILPSLN